MATARVALLSSYELGHQPLGLAAPAAALRARGHDVSCLDLSVEPLDEARLRDADLIALSVPMHTAARLALRLVPSLRAANPRALLALYGLYASLLDDRLPAGSAVDAVAGGEYEPALCALADSVAAGAPFSANGAGLGGAPDFPRQHYPLPDRSGLPPLERYARLEAGERVALTGYVETTRGCAHRCTHCPWTAVYEGRLRLVPPEVVLADIEQLVGLGARHITFGDPDLFNAVRHTLEIASELHRRHPDLTFDATIKVEHLLRHGALLPELRALGCLFVTSAFESTNDEVLRQFRKGHTRADLDAAVRLCAEAGLALRPTWVAFTPWGTAEDLLDLLEFIETRGLVGHVAPVQYGLRLLVPPGSALITPLRAQGLLGGYDAEALSYGWAPHDPRVDALQARIAKIVEQVAHGGGARDLGEIFARVKRAALEAVHGRSAAREVVPPRQPVAPGLTESWFC